MKKKQQSAETFFERVKKNILTQTDPVVMKKVFTELKLDDFQPRDVSFARFLHKLRNESVNITSLVEKIISSLLKNEPLCSLAAYIQDEELIDDSEIKTAANDLQLFFNLLCFFEAFVVSLSNSPTSAEDTYLFIQKQRKSPRPGNPFINLLFGVPLRTNLFERLKMIAIDRPMLRIVLHKSTKDKKETIEDVKRFVKKHQLSGSYAEIPPAACGSASPLQRTPFLALNIMEAVWVDAKQGSSSNGHMDNAIAGIGLIAILEDKQYPSYYQCLSTVLPQGVSTETNNRYPLLPDLEIDQTSTKVETMEVDLQWMNAYLSWHLFFCITNYKNVLPPMTVLIPSILATEPSFLIEKRAMVIFLVINFIIKKITFFSMRLNFKNEEKIISKWGEINKEYTERILKILSPNISKNPTQLYQDTFGRNLNFNFLKKILFSFKNPNKFYVTFYGKKSNTKN